MRVSLTVVNGDDDGSGGRDTISGILVLYFSSFL